MDDMDIITLKAKLKAAYELVNSGTLHGKQLVWHIYRARGLHKLTTSLGLELGDDEALDICLGAPHWLTYNDGTLAGMCHAS